MSSFQGKKIKHSLEEQKKYENLFKKVKNSRKFKKMNEVENREKQKIGNS